MDRRRFIGLSTAGLAAPTLVRAQSAPSVIVVGAGAAGLTAAYHLKRAGAEVTILEAAPEWGGRVARMARFADFPIDLGAEWIHEDATILAIEKNGDITLQSHKTKQTSTVSPSKLRREITTPTKRKPGHTYDE